MKNFFIKIFDKVAHNQTYALIISIVLFVGIVIGIPYLTNNDQKTVIPPTPNVVQTNNQNEKTFTGNTKLAKEQDKTKNAETDHTSLPTSSFTKKTTTQITSLPNNSENVSDNYYTTPSSDQSATTPTAEIINTPPIDTYTIVDQPVVDKDISSPAEPANIVPSPVWEESDYQYQDDTIKADFGSKVTDKSKVVYEAPVWQDNDGKIFTDISNWLDRITNRNLKKIEFALVNSFDSRTQAPPKIDLPISDFESSFWNSIKNFFVKIYENDSGNLILSKESGQDIVINQNVLSNINVKYKIIANKGIKEEIVVVNKNNITNSFTFTLKLDNGVKYQQNSNLTADAPADVYYFSDSQDNYFAHFVPLFAQDLAGNKTENVSMTITPLYGNYHQITIKVDPTWIYDTSRKFPITIDPSIVHDTQAEFETAQSLNRTVITDSKVSLTQTPSAKNNSTVGLWHMDETSGVTVTDVSGNGVNGTATGTSLVDGKFGKARSFNGTSDYVSIPDSNVFNPANNNITISTWIKFTSVGANDLIAGKSGSYWLAYNTPDAGIPANTLGFGINDIVNNSANVSFQPTVGRWYHIAGTYDQSKIKLYIDGQLMAEKAYSTAIVDNANAFNIGAFSGAPGSYAFNGTIDETKIDNRVLTSDEIKSLAQFKPYGIYDSAVMDLGSSNPMISSFSWSEQGVQTDSGETPKDTTGLAAQWNFNETSGTTATNNAGSCGSACNGTLTNMTTTGQDASVNSGWTANNKKWGTGALMFDGINDYVSMPDNDTYYFSSNDFAIETWFKINNINTNDYQIVASQFNGDWNNRLIWYLDNRNSQSNPGMRFGYSVGGVYSEIAETTTNGISQWKPGEWYHVVVSKTGNEGKIYRNGVLLVSKTITTPLSNFAGSLYLGGEPVENKYFNGTIDLFRVYKNRGLQPDEILSNYQAGNIEFQTRTGATADANDGSWEGWKPAGSGTETQLLSNDNDSSNWSWDSLATYMPKSIINSSIVKSEGVGSLKVQSGVTQPDANTVALLHLDETSGSGAYIKDVSGNSNHGTPTGTTVVDGMSGKGRSFNGTSDYINLGNSSTVKLNNGTIETWIKTNNAGNGYRGIIVKAGAYSLFLKDNNLAIYDWSISTERLSGINLADNSWHHIVETFQSGVSNGTNIYIDGVLRFTTTMSVGTQNVGLSIGTGYDNPNGQEFNGIIDEVKISNIARTSEEIAEAYRAGRDHRLTRTFASNQDLSNKTKLPFYIAADKTGSYLETTIGESAFANYEADANTVGLWHLEEATGSGAYLKDSSSVGNNGTPTGTSLVDGKIGNGRSFNGTSNFINNGNNSVLALTNNITVSFWVKNPTASNYYSGVVTKGQLQNGYGWAITMPSNTTAMCFYALYGSTWAGNCDPINAASSWSQYTFTYDGLITKIYRNGTLVNSENHSGNISYGSGYDLMIGNSGDNNRFFNGILDEVRIDNIARTPEEIRQAYEVGARTHTITIDFAANLDSDNLIADSNDKSFTIDATTKGLSYKAENLFTGDKIIIRENYDGTEYVAQGLVNGVDQTTGAVTVSSWDSGSTFPSGGYTVNADIFKWQREYWDLTGIADDQIDTANRITVRLTDGSEGRNIWLDDFESVSSYLTDSTGSTINSTAQRYLQYRAILSTTDTAVTPSFSNVTFNYTAGNPTIVSASTSAVNLNNTNKTSFPINCEDINFGGSDNVTCQASFNQTNWYTVTSQNGPLTHATLSNTVNVTGWNGYPTNDGAVVIYVRVTDGTTPSSVVSFTITKDTAVNAGIDHINSVADDSAVQYIDMSDDNNTLVSLVTIPNIQNIRWDVTDVSYDTMTNNCSSLTSCLLNLSGNGAKTVYLRTIDNLGNKSSSSFVLQYTVQTPIVNTTINSSLAGEQDMSIVVNITPSFNTPLTNGSIKLKLADEFDFSGLTINDVTASGGDVTWTNDEQIYAGGTQIAQAKNWFVDIVKAQGENSITFNFTGDISAEDGEISFVIGGVNLPGNPPTSGPYSYILEWYEQHNAGGSPLYIQDGKVYINEGTTVSASVPSSFTFIINPVTTGTINGANITTSTTSGSSVNFGSFDAADNRITAHDLVVSTNATNGYLITTQYTGPFASASDTMTDFTGTNDIPTSWATPPGSGVESYFGYTTNDSSLLNIITNRFTSSGGNKWAAFTTIPTEVVYSDTAVDNQTTRIGYRLQITNLQPAGVYSTNVMYVATPTF